LQIAWNFRSKKASVNPQDVLAIFAKVFRGELVEPDLNHEPAEESLKRI
jgi:hypothetical protein